MRPSRLLIPILGELTLADARLADLARLSGVDCEITPLEEVLRPAHSHASGSTQLNACLVVNAAVFKEWETGSGSALTLLPTLTEQWRFLFVHGLQADPFTNSLVNELSDGTLKGIGPPEPGSRYCVAADSRAFSGPLAGLVFGPARPTDRVLQVNSKPTRIMASVGRESILACHSRNGAEILFLAGGDLADLDATVDELRLETYFSRLALPVMALRFLFGEICWQPRDCYATLIIDDPALWKRFGFLKFDRVLEMLDQHRFHMSVAFIPYNYRRSTRAVAEMFRTRPDRLSLCYHGNDHTAGEFMSTDRPFLNSALKSAASRMQTHKAQTGIHHDDVMVFPQGGFSSKAMGALQSNNFVAAINSGGYPRDEPNSLTLADLIAPAVTKFGGFPVFFRRYVRDYSAAEIALQCFFGKPLMIGEHHEIFKEPDLVTALVSTIRSVVPEARWTNAQTALEHSSLYRRAGDGSMHVRVYANQGILHNDSLIDEDYFVERCDLSAQDVDHVDLDRQRCRHEVTAGGLLRFACHIGPGESRTFRVVYNDDLTTSSRRSGFREKSHVFVRRRLSEFRDMYLSRNASLLTAAQSIRDRLWNRS